MQNKKNDRQTSFPNHPVHGPVPVHVQQQVTTSTQRYTHTCPTTYTNAVLSTVVNLVVPLRMYNTQVSFQLPSENMNALNMWNGRDHSRADASVHMRGEICIAVVV